jgi:hypothetical protein
MLALGWAVSYINHQTLFSSLTILLWLSLNEGVGFERQPGRGIYCNVTSIVQHPRRL